MFGTYVGKCGLKTSTPSPGFEERLAEELLEDLRPRAATTTFSAVAGSAELAVHVRGGRRAELRQAERRAVVRLAGADGLDRRPRWPWRVRRERAVADLQLDDVLAGGLELLGDGQHGEGRLDVDR